MHHRVRPYPTFQEFSDKCPLAHPESLLKDLAIVRGLREEFAAAIIADGIFGSNPMSDDVVELMMERNEATQRMRESLLSFFEQAKAAGVVDEIAVPRPDNPDDTESADDALTTYMLAWNDAAFSLGVAVGSVLGPNALEGVSE